MVLVIEDEDGHRDVYESSSPVCRMTRGEVSVEVHGRETDTLENVVNACHVEFQWLEQKKREEVFAEHR